MKLTNIKVSCKLNKPFPIIKASNANDVLVYCAGVGRTIVKIDCYTYTIMGRNCQHLNLTGVSKVCDIENALEKFGVYFLENNFSFSHIKIDSMSAVVYLNSNLLQSILHTEANVIKNFHLKKYHNITSRINLKLKKPLSCSPGMSANIFTRGACTLFGAKREKDLHTFVNNIICSIIN
jgi:hypothetical protein